MPRPAVALSGLKEAARGVDNHSMDVILPAENFNQLTQTRYGPMLVNRHDLYVGRSLAVYGEWCEFEVELFNQIVRPGDVVLDVGANIGAHTLPLARAVGKDGLVGAFEPQRILYQALCGNIALNSLTNVHTWLAAVGAAPGSLLVPPLDYEREDNFGGVRLGGGAGKGEPVDVITIDQLGLEACRLIKIDVEEMEAEVLRGGVRTLETLKPLLYVENNPGPLAGDLISLIDALDYTMYWHLTPYNNPKNFKQAAPIFPDGLLSYNMICVHKSLGVSMTGFREVEVPAAGPLSP